MKKVKVNPMPDRFVVNPNTGRQIKSGDEVTLCTQIKRYIKFGDLEIIEPKQVRKK